MDMPTSRIDNRMPEPQPNQAILRPYIPSRQILHLPRRPTQSPQTIPPEYHTLPTSPHHPYPIKVGKHPLHLEPQFHPSRRLQILIIFLKRVLLLLRTSKEV